jgi:hypothetical protein
MVTAKYWPPLMESALTNFEEQFLLKEKWHPTHDHIYTL